MEWGTGNTARHHERHTAMNKILAALTAFALGPAFALTAIAGAHAVGFTGSGTFGQDTSPVETEEAGSNRQR